MADERAQRPFILQWRSAVLNSTLPATGKLCLIVLSEFADADGSNCYPSIQMVASKASINEKTARANLTAAANAGWIQRISKGTTQGWKRFEYTPIVPEGADTTPARHPEGAGVTPVAIDERCGHSVRKVRALRPEGAGVTPYDLSITYPVPREKQKHVQQEQPPADRFREFWAAYPRKAGKPKAEQVWKSKKLDKVADQILTDVLARVADQRQWTDPTYIPHPSTYLNQRRWEDEWSPSAITSVKPGAADDFREKLYTGTAIEDIPESLRPTNV